MVIIVILLQKSRDTAMNNAIDFIRYRLATRIMQNKLYYNYIDSRNQIKISDRTFQSKIRGITTYRLPCCSFSGKIVRLYEMKHNDVHTTTTEFVLRCGAEFLTSWRPQPAARRMRNARRYDVYMRMIINEWDESRGSRPLSLSAIKYMYRIPILCIPER